MPPRMASSRRSRSSSTPATPRWQASSASSTRSATSSATSKRRMTPVFSCSRSPSLLFRMPPFQLLAEPWELHVLLLRADVSSPLCEPRVYGPLPSVLQARFALLDEEALGSQNIVSLQLNSRGGHLLSVCLLFLSRPFQVRSGLGQRAESPAFGLEEPP